MAHEVRAKKHLGQHFLNDESIARQIVDAVLEIDATRPLIEIGPGTGVLTQHLIALPGFYALDVDEESVQFLKQKYSSVLSGIADKKAISDDAKKELVNALNEFKAIFQAAKV